MKKILIILGMLLLLSDYCYALSAGGYDAGAINRDYVLDMRLHDVVQREKKKNSAIISTKRSPQTQEQITTSSNIKSITFVNNYSIPSSQLVYAVKDRLNQPMTQENISAIRKDVMKYYQNQGFFSAVATVSAQDTQTGELVIEIKEGGRNSIQIEY